MLFSFSIVICTYNRGYIVSRAIESILNQKYDSNFYEIIIVNDNSSDDTEEILKKYKENLTIIKNEINIGCARSKNIGIECAKNDWICFLDSDDFYNENCLEGYNYYINNYLLKNINIDLLYYNPTVIGDNTIPDQINSKVMQKIENCVIGGTFIVRNKKFKESNIQFPDKKYANDYYFYLLAKENGWTINKIEDNVNFYNYDRISSCKDSITKNKEILSK